MCELSKGIIIFRSLKQIMGTMKQFIDGQFRNMDITVPQVMLMGTLAHDGKMKISDLSEKLGLSNSTVSGIIDRLEKQGLVERIRSKQDRRVVYVNITCQFEKTAQKNFAEVEKKFDQLINKASPKELDTILKGLDTLKRIIGEQAN